MTCHQKSLVEPKALGRSPPMSGALMPAIPGSKHTAKFPTDQTEHQLARPAHSPFSAGMLDYLILQQLLGYRPIQATVPCFQPVICLASHMPGTCVCKKKGARITEAELPAQVLDPRACLGLLQKSHGLLFRKRLLHIESSVRADWT